MSRFIREYIAKAQELSVQGATFVTVTLIAPEGHVPQDIGAKAIVSKAGIVWGTIGGGRLEAKAIDHAKGLISRAETASNTDTVPCLVRYDLQQDLNMVCGGVATLFYELAANRTWNIAVFGAGHVAQAVVPLLASFECNLWCVDHREDWLGKIPARANLEKVLTPNLPAFVRQLPENIFYLCISQGHATDLPIVREILKRDGDTSAFIGVIGSVPKARTLRAQLLQEGFTEDQVNAIHCPVGLPIGTNAPSEIAVSIAAQLLQKRDELAKVKKT